MAKIRQEAVHLRAECFASQASAGFKTHDTREVNCPECHSPGFNTGWGYWAFACGAEITDGEFVKDCEAQEATPDE